MVSLTILLLDFSKILTLRWLIGCLPWSLVCEFEFDDWCLVDRWYWFGFVHTHWFDPVPGPMEWTWIRMRYQIILYVLYLSCFVWMKLCLGAEGPRRVAILLRLSFRMTHCNPYYWIYLYSNLHNVVYDLYSKLLNSSFSQNAGDSCFECH